MFGENLTTTGLAGSGAVIGARWAAGSTRLQVCQPRYPCAKLGVRFGDPRFVRDFGRASRPGAYLRILAEGDVGAGDEVDVVHRPDHGVTVALVSYIGLFARERAPEVLAAPELAAQLRDWFTGSEA